MDIFNKKKRAARVLLVEDDALLAKILSDSFVEDGFEVINITNGLEVLEMAKKFEPDIVLLDLILPGLDGFAVLKQLKAETQTKDIPVAVISNLGDVSDVKSAKALGADEYFIKANTQLEKIIEFVRKKIK